MFGWLILIPGCLQVSDTSFCCLRSLKNYFLKTKFITNHPFLIQLLQVSIKVGGINPVQM